MSGPTSFLSALTLLAGIVGKEITMNAAEAQSFRERDGTWTVRSENGETLAEVNPTSGTCIVNAINARVHEIATAVIVSTRVVCNHCRQPKVLRGYVRSGVHFVCGGCERTAFVVID